MDTALSSPLPLTAPRARAALWLGRGLTGLIVAFLFVDAAVKIVLITPVVEASHKLGLDVATVRPLGLVLAASTLLHVIPRTQLLGAVLVTAYLGGATATHVLTGTPWWFPVALGIVLWLAYGLRSAELRAFVLSATLEPLPRSKGTL